MALRGKDGAAAWSFLQPKKEIADYVEEEMSPRLQNGLGRVR